MAVLAPDDRAFVTEVYDTTPTQVTGAASVNPDPTREYVAGGAGYFRGIGDAVLPRTIDDVTRLHGFRVHDAMMAHPAVSSAVEALTLAIMAPEFKLTETHPADPGQSRLTRDQKRSADARDFCQRLMDRVPGWRSSIQQGLECMTAGNKLGEKTSREVLFGPDAGRMVLDTLNIKKRNTWQFVIDPSYRVSGILTRDREGKTIRVRPDKFIWFTWMPKDNDPRGTSILRAAYTAWNLTIKLYPQYYKFLSQYAVASLVGTTAPGATDHVDAITGKRFTAQQWYRMQIEGFQNGSVLVKPHGALLEAIEATGDGAALLKAFEYFDQQMTVAILMQTRATREAKHGSKADAEQGGDIFALLVMYGREMLCDAIRQHIFRYYLAMNFGTEYADTFLPYVYLGSVEQQDKPAAWNAIANLMRAGFITPSMKIPLCAENGLPIPDMEADEKAAEEEQQRQAELMQPPGDDPSDDGAGSGDDGEKPSGTDGPSTSD